MALLALIRRFDSDSIDDSDLSTYIQKAVNKLCFTMRWHSNLVGSQSGKSQSNYSVSFIQELYTTIAQALQKPYHDLLFTVHRMVIPLTDGMDRLPIYQISSFC